MPSDHNNWNFPSSKKSTVVTCEEFLRRAAEAISKLSEQDKARMRQRLLEYLKLDPNLR